MGASLKNAHAPVLRGTSSWGTPETCVRKNHVSRSVLDGQVPEFDLHIYRFPVRIRTHDRHPCSKKVGALGATVDNYPNPLSLLKNSVPSLTGGKSFLSGALGAVVSAKVRQRAVVHLLGADAVLAGQERPAIWCMTYAISRRSQI